MDPNICPICHEPAEENISQIFFEKRCKNYHTWHLCKIHNNIALGYAPRDLISGVMFQNLYQPYAIKHGIGRKLIIAIQQYGGKYRILTKSQRIVEDKELLAYSKGKVGLSIPTSQDNEVKRKYWEPMTVSISHRLNALKELDDFGGIPLWVSAEPFLPGTNFRKYYEDIIEYGGVSLQEIVIGKMNYEIV